MIKISYSRKLKIGVLLAFGILMVAQASAALSFNSPSSNSNNQGTVTLNVSTGSSSNLTFQVKKPGSSSYKVLETRSVSSNSIETKEYGAATGEYGSYDFKVNNSGNTTDEITNVTLDGDKPKIDSKTPTGYITDDSPTVELKTSDPTTSVVETNISVEGKNDSGTNSASVDLTSLKDGSYTVDYTVKDDVGNWKNGSWSFTVDTEYKGDASPSFDPGAGVYKLSDGETFDLTVTLEGKDDGEDSDITVTCYDSDDNDIDSSTKNVGSDESKDFTCEIDGADYAGKTEDIYAEMCDQAGNCKTTDEKTYKFDAEAPSVFNLATSSGASSFGKKFSVGFSVSDDVSDIEQMEYYFDTPVSEGEGTKINYSGGDTSFEVDPSGIGSGSHTLYLRAKDEAGRWSDAKTLDFEYYPNREPNISVSVSSDIQIVAGNSKSFVVEVENTGKLYIKSLDVEVSSPVFSGSKTIKDLKQGVSKSKTFDISTSKDDIGKYNLTVSTKNPSSERKVSLRVKASKEQRKNIQSSFSKVKKRFEELKKNVTELKSKLNDQRRQRLISNFSAVNKSIEEAEKALEAGEYYKVQSIVNNFESNFTKASDSYEKVKEEHRKSQRTKMIIAGAIILLISVTALLGYLFKSGKVDRKMLRDLGVDLGKLDELIVKLESKLKGEDEAEEFEWDGFED